MDELSRFICWYQNLFDVFNKSNNYFKHKHRSAVKHSHKPIGINMQEPILIKKKPMGLKRLTFCIVQTSDGEHGTWKIAKFLELR